MTALKPTWLIIILILSFQVFSQAYIPAESQRKIDRILKLVESDEMAELRSDKSLPLISIDGNLHVSMLARANPGFSEKDLTDGVILSSRSGHILSLKVPLMSLKELQKARNLDVLEISPRITPDLQRAILDTRVDSVHAGINLPGPFTGKNVIIGITDWGFDYTHPMFYDTSLSHTRILASWDQSRNSGPPPQGYNYGTEIVGENDLLSYQSDSATYFYGNATHGSHVAGIAGGGGAGIGLYGMAPSCEFLFCQVFLDVAATLDAVNWMKDFAKKEKKRLVINMSWGLYQLGPLDGTSLISQAFDALIDSGVVIVTSNGNNGGTNLHIQKSFSSDTITSKVGMSFSSSSDYWGQNIIMWGSQNTSFSSGLDVYQSNNLVASTPYYNTASKSGYMDSIIVIGSDTIWYSVSQDSLHPLNNCPHMSLKVRNLYNKYTIVLKSTSANSDVHYLNIAYNLDHVANWGYNFTSYGKYGVGGDNNYTVGEPACTKNVISVGAHNSEVRLPFDTLNGDITSFSSRGPTQDERTKPEITAPGSNVLSSISSFTDESYITAESTNFNGRKYDFAKFSGTSMSGPMVTGIVALILEARRFATPEEIKNILITTARTDDKTGIIPASGSNTWGWGKVNARLAVEKAIDVVSVEDIIYESDWLIYPNPGRNDLNLKSTSGKSADKVMIIDMQGRTLLEEGNASLINTSFLQGGLYMICIYSDNQVVKLRWVK